MLNVLLVALGGGLGAAGRFGVSLALPARADGWPFATFAINVAGSFLIGLLAGWLSTKGEAGEPWRLLLGVGVLGGFTTFSTFSVEAVGMARWGNATGALAYAVSSVVLGVALVALGRVLGSVAFGSAPYDLQEDEEL